MDAPRLNFWLKQYKKSNINILKFYTLTYIHTHTQIYIHTYIHTHTNIHIHIHIHIHIYTHTHTHTHIHIYIYIYLFYFGGGGHISSYIIYIHTAVWKFGISNLLLKNLKKLTLIQQGCVKLIKSESKDILLEKISIEYAIPRRILEKVSQVLIYVCVCVCVFSRGANFQETFLHYHYTPM